MTVGHAPVLVTEVMAALALQNGDTYVDGTFGAGGYMRAALEHDIARGIGIDRDATALSGAKIADQKVVLIEGRFGTMDRLLADHGVAGDVDAIALDVGVSSMQLDDAARGFSFMRDGPLDMRMGASGLTAADFVNGASEAELADVLFRYGDEPKARRIARALVHDRPFERTAALAAVVRSVCGPSATGKDPATRTFQALRIHINDELGELEAGLRAAERLLRAGGRLAIVTFHSLEDRLVKSFFRQRSGQSPAGSRHRPIASAPAPTFTGVVKAVRPSNDEIIINPRARSATLRAAVRTGAPAWGAL